MDPRTWGEQLLNYGPYAVLALFVLWVAPAQLKAFRESRQGDRTQQAVSGFVAIGCWLIVFVMVYYIYAFWPPRKVYLGTLGTHPAGALFNSTSPELFIVSHPVGNDGRLRWDYVVVTDGHEITATDKFEFAFQWGHSEEEHTDFYLPLNVLQKRRIDLRAEPGHPDNLVYDNGDPAMPLPLPRYAGAPARALPTPHAGLISAAYAQPRPSIDKSVLVEWLGSANTNLRAQARAQLRQLTPDELRQLLQTPGLSAAARQQIDAELKGRG
jgi:hypothetical protein